MIIDLHVHTRLSADSRIEAEQYLATAQSAGAGLGAICFTEHRLFPTDAETDRLYAELSDRYAIRIFKGIEADTDLGHLLIFGVTGEMLRRFDPESRMHRARRLMEIVHGEGGIAIPAHPFRDSGFGVRLDELLAELGPALSAIEAINGQNSEAQNRSACDAARKLGLIEVGGSDAHFVTPKWFLTCATELECEVATVDELCTELRAGRARPYLFPDSSNDA
jgi:predicted metal-dependent phosphoesterase TrpH